MQIHRKPIYDDLPASLSPGAVANAPSTPPTKSIPASPTASTTPTDRLAKEIGKARLLLHGQVKRAEDFTNRTMTQALRLEHDFTSTIAGLAPGKETGEKLLPNGLYVLVAAMAGSILTRRSNIIFRATLPPAIGVGAAYVVLPHTTRNVGNLVWSWEEKYPVVRDTHIRVQDRVTKFVQTGIEHSKMGVAMAEDKVGDVRKSIEQWTKKGL